MSFKPIKHMTHVRGAVRGTFQPHAKLPTDFQQSHRYICLGFNKGTNNPPCCNLWREQNFCRFYGYKNVLAMRMVSCFGFNKPAPTDEMLDKGLNIIEVVPTKPKPLTPLPNPKNRIVVTAFAPETPKVSKVIPLPTKSVDPPSPIIRVVKTEPYEFSLFPKQVDHQPAAQVFEQVSVGAVGTVASMPVINSQPAPPLDDWWQSLNQALQAVPKQRNHGD